MVVRRLVVVAALLNAGSSFIRRGNDCEGTPAVEFGYDVFTTCRFLGSECSTLREKIGETIQAAIRDLKRLDDGTGKKVPLLKQPWDSMGEEDNSTDEQCRVPVGVQVKLLYNKVSPTSSKYSIVGASLGVVEGTYPEHHPVKLSWSVMFREVKPKSNISRWWEEMTSREGSSYNLFWVWTGLTTEGPPPGKYLFSLGLAVVSCLFILKVYY